MKNSQEQDLAARKLLHTTVFDQCYSPCGKYLVAANNFGNIAVYSVVASLAQDAGDNSRRPIYSFTACTEGAIYCLVSTDTFLISAGNGDIVAWKWSEILDKAAKQVWTLKIPHIRAFTSPEINSLALNVQESGVELYGGCGDNNVYIWDTETGQETGILSGHSDYVHSVCMKNSGRECVSASEDGTVRIWDTRASKNEAMHTLEPCKNEKTARPELGKWVGCVTCDSTEDWLICGGGPHLASWHLRSLSPMATFNSPGVTHNCVKLHEDLVLSGGGEPYVSHWYMNGDQKTRVPCSPSNVFNIAVNKNSESNKILSVAGSSAKIDVCTNYGYSYKAFSLMFTV